MDLQKQGNIIEASILFYKAEELLKANPSVKLQYLTFNNLACLHLSQKDFTKSLQYLAKCLGLQSEDTKSAFFNIGVLLNISAIKSKLSNHNEALNYGLKAFSILEKVKNQCLKSICYYSIGLEYEYLQQYGLATEYYANGWKYSNHFFGPANDLTSILNAALKACKKKSENLVDQFCILRENNSSIRGRSGLETRSRGATQKNEYYIKVDTTPWIESDKWKFKPSSNTPNPIEPKNKLIQGAKDLNKTLTVPIRLEEKLNFIGKKLANLNGQLSNIEKLFQDPPEKKEDTKTHKKIQAAIVIQKYFRKYLKKKRKMNLKVHGVQTPNHKIKTIPFLMIQNLQKSVNIKLSNRSEKSIQTSSQRNRNGIKFKGLLYNIIYLQRHIKGYLARRRFKVLRSKAIAIQKTYRMYQVRKIFRKIKNAIVFIQQTYRQWLLIKNI